MTDLSPHEQQKVDEALDRLSDGDCPIDGGRLWLFVEVDEVQTAVFECAWPNKHRWPAERDAGDWIPQGGGELAASLDQYGVL